MTKAQSQKIKQLMKVLRAVRKKCLDCSVFNPHEVKKCWSKDCPIYSYRMGLKFSGEKIPHKKPNSTQKTLSETEVKIKCKQ